MRGDSRPEHLEEKTSSQGLQVALILTCPFSELRTPAPRTVLTCPLRKDSWFVPLPSSIEEFLLNSPSEPTYICCSISNKSSGKKYFMGFEADFGLWCLDTSHLLRIWHPMGTPSTWLNHSAWPGCVSSQDLFRSLPGCFREAQMTYRPKSRSDYNQRSFWSLMSWNIFLSNLLF